MFRTTQEISKSPHDPRQSYLLGLRGCLAIMTFLWTFLQLFLPSAVKSSTNSNMEPEAEPDYAPYLGKTLSILFWNDSLIYSSLIFLSARTICLPFLVNPTKSVLASSVFRRGLRLGLPTGAALILVYIIFSKTTRVEELQEFAKRTNNTALQDEGLYILPSSLANFNAVFNIFWTNQKGYYNQAGNLAFPSQTLWILSTIFQQSYTVYTSMVIIPYTNPTWRFRAAILFILSAWWCYSWAWFSITGLFIAGIGTTSHHPIKSKLAKHIPSIRILALIAIASGFTMQFLWITHYPSLANSELKYHTNPYTSGGLNISLSPSNPQLRGDIYLIILGFHILLETTTSLQAVLKCRMLVWLGRRSLSYFLIQAIVIYTLGVKIYTSITGPDSMNGYGKGVGVAFISCLLVTLVTGEVWYWLIDLASQRFAIWLFNWIRI